MAKNLREKLPKDDVLLVNDINHRACDAFVKELSGYAVRASPSAREIAEQAVCLSLTLIHHLRMPSMMLPFVLSMTKLGSRKTSFVINTIYSQSSDLLRFQPRIMCGCEKLLLI